MQTKTGRSTFVLCGAFVAMLVALPLTTANARWLEKGKPLLPYGVYLDGLQGSVVLSLTLDRSGHVTDTQVLRSSGSKTLDGLAEEAAAKWRLSPNAVVATDLTQGRVEKITFVHGPPVPKSLLPNSTPYWAVR
ncbi:MAG: energy transducer TonB [Chthoniobacterales bacterium]|nr:energy transducer TonB [Chthoniobacterales bacterium]